MGKLGERTERNMTPPVCALAMLILGICLMPNIRCLAEELPEWTQRISKEHPRLFFNSQTWPAVRHRALGAERQWYLSIKARVDRLAETAGGKDSLETKE